MILVRDIQIMTKFDNILQLSQVFLR